MKHFAKLFILLVIVFSSCRIDNRKEIEENVKAFPKVYDTTGIEKFIFYKEDSPTWLTTSNYKLFYIGKVQDTIFLNPYLNFGPFSTLPSEEQNINTEKKQKLDLENYFLKWPQKKNYKFWYQSKVEIRIDTSNLFSKSYPTLLTNMENDTIIIAYGQQIPLIMEAKDSIGNWKPIQTRYIYICGVGVGSIILPPKECLMTLSPIFIGNYRTLLRVSLGNNHSNLFYGNINYRQMQSMFDESGNYNEAYTREMKDEATNR